MSGEPDALSLVDDWCKRRAAKLSQPMERHVAKGGSLDDAEYRRQLGQHQAFMLVRSYIHGLRSNDPVQS